MLIEFHSYLLDLIREIFCGMIFKLFARISSLVADNHDWFIYW